MMSGRPKVFSLRWLFLLSLLIAGPGVYADSKGDVVDVATTVILPSEVRLPPGFDPSRKYDLLVALHGFGSSPDRFADISQPLTRAGMIFAAPQAPTPFLVEGNLGFDWDRAHDEPNGSERRLRFGRASVDYIVDVIEALKARYSIRHVYLFGFSQGGAYAYLAGIHHSDLVSGIVAVGMGFDAGWFEAGALESASGIPVLIAHSPTDQRIPFKLAQESAETLKDLGYDVSLYEYSGGHRVTGKVLENTVLWIEHLAAAPGEAGAGSKAGDMSTGE